FFALSNGLWASDGTAAGTVLLGPGSLRSMPISAAGGIAFIPVYVTSLRAGELLKSNGTPQGTVTLATFSDTASTGYVPSDLTDFAGELYFNAATEIWRSDGTPQGTQMLPDWPTGVSSALSLTPSGGRLFFVGGDAAHGAELWKVELPGTVAGSAFVDANHDGLRESGETDLVAATVYLDA